MKKIIINVAVFFAMMIVLGVFVIVMPKKTPDSYCATLAKEIVKMTSDKETKFITIENARDERKKAPGALDLPGVILRSCSGIAFTEDGEKTPVFFYESRKEGSIINADHFIGYEEQ